MESYSYKSVQLVSLNEVQELKKQNKKKTTLNKIATIYCTFRYDEPSTREAGLCSRNQFELRRSVLITVKKL